jgi:anti-sigma factor RsiW
MEPLSHKLTESDEFREELVSYLDGELDAEQSRQVEQRAAVEPGARRLLEDFDRSWHMLDELDSPPTSEDFTRTTLEMVALAAAKDAAKAKAEAPRRRRRATLWIAAGLLGAAAAGFFIVAAVVPDPNAELLRDLPILERLDQYHQTESIEFLRALNEKKVFPEEADHGR